MASITSEQRVSDANIEAIALGSDAAEQVLKSSAETLAKHGAAAEQEISANARALADGGKIALNGFQELANAYQALATRNAERLTSSIQALAAVKTPAGFVELQHKLIAEGLEAAVNDFQNIAKLTAAAFSATFEPLRKRIDAPMSRAGE